MLVRFAVENFRSIKEKQEFSMVTGTHRRHPSHFIHCNGVKLLKGSFIFGANAAGKSTLIRAMAFVRNIVRRGLSFSELNNQHFRVDSEMYSRPGIFQFDIFSNGHFYSYGLAISYKECRIEGEWLYLCDKGEKKIFERYLDEGKTVITTDISFSDAKSKQIFEVLAETISDDVPFLKEVCQRKLKDNEDFEPYYDMLQWFVYLTIIFPTTKYQNRNDISERGFMTHLLSDFDTGIEGIYGREQPAEKILSFLPDDLLSEIIGDLKDHIEESTQKKDNLEEETRHDIKVGMSFEGRQYEFRMKDNILIGKQLKMDHGNPNDLFDFYDESDGTQRLIDLLPVFEAGKKERVIVVDELDRSFHTKLLQHYIEHFYHATEGRKSQLIATVHDSNIMDLDILRQDEIWFIERQEDHSSKVYSLNRFKVRYDKKAARDYLIGRYGAIPSIYQIGESEDMEVEE